MRSSSLIHFLLPFLFGSCVVSTFAQELRPIEDPSKLGFSSEGLDRITSEMQKEIDSGSMIGCAALVSRKGEIAYSNVWGYRNRKKELPVKDNTIWRIYSMSKPVTSVAVMQLVERGKLKLDDAVATHLPEFKELEVYDPKGKKKKEDSLSTSPAARTMTVRDLLRHTSGLTYGFFGNTPVDQAYRRAGVLVWDNDLKEMTTKLGKIPLLYQPGTRFHYSASTDVLGRLVEVVSGESLKDFFDDNILRPLDMKDTYFTIPKTKQDRFAEMYRFNEKELVPANRLSSVRFVDERNRFYSGGGGLCSTTRDYLRFATMLLNGGELDGKRILKRETIQQMTKNQLPPKSSARNFKFGLGFSINKDGHYSWGGAAGTRFWVDPKNQMITLFMVQINPYRGGHGEKFKKLAYEALQQP